MTRIFLVSLVQVRRRGRVSFGISTEEADGPFLPTIGYHLVTWSVECTTKGEAAGAVLHWLARGAPSGQLVREAWRAESMRLRPS